LIVEAIATTADGTAERDAAKLMLVVELVVTCRKSPRFPPPDLTSVACHRRRIIPNHGFFSKLPTAGKC
jgi:hypothetical protein